jgi:hypothetical protein
MENALTCLVFVADGLVRGNATLGDIGPTEDEYLSISRLIGRASVHLSFERKGIVVSNSNQHKHMCDFLQLKAARLYLWEI